MLHSREIKDLIGSGNIENIELAFALIASQAYDAEYFLEPYRILFNLSSETIEAEWLAFQISSCMMLTLSDRNLEELPEEIGYFSKLSVLWLNSNRLSSLPESFSKLNNLSGLHLGGNCFKEIPKVLFEMEN